MLNLGVLRPMNSVFLYRASNLGRGFSFYRSSISGINMLKFACKVFFKEPSMHHKEPWYAILGSSRDTTEMVVVCRNQDDIPATTSIHPLRTTRFDYKIR